MLLIYLLSDTGAISLTGYFHKNIYADRLIKSVLKQTAEYRSRNNECRRVKEQDVSLQVIVADKFLHHFVIRYFLFDFRYLLLNTIAIQKISAQLAEV